MLAQYPGSAQPAVNPSPPVVLEDLPVCGNCHSFSGDGETTFGLLSQVSPDGRYVISTVKDRAVFVATPDIWYSQLFFPIKGILVVYDTETGTFKPLPGADDPEYVQSNPTWSPDGKWVVFARTKAYRKDSIANATSVLLSEKDVPEFVEDKEPFKFDLYRVPFNDGRGGKAEPIEGASHNGKSDYFAKFSPDGKWIVFCKAENYMLLMPDSELHFERFLVDVRQLLLDEHKEDYCGIVYADDHDRPNFVKIFDPNNLGKVCGSSEVPPLPGWTLSRVAPDNLEHAFPQTADRRRWWQRIFR